ncbi:MAG: hypothetical protein OXQ28_11345 [Acidobacteriota bacterium]|nr:hypothetical protein [Acidobacteriota bacterium]
MALSVVVRGLLSAQECADTARRMDAGGLVAAPIEYRRENLEAWRPFLTCQTQRDRLHYLDQPGGWGVTLAIPYGDVPWGARARDALLSAARILGLDIDTDRPVAWEAGDHPAGLRHGEQGLERYIQAIRYPPGAWLEEHRDTPTSFRVLAPIKISATVRLSGPQTVSWGWMDVPDLELGDMVAYAGWRPHYVAPCAEVRHSAVLSALGPPWR